MASSKENPDSDLYGDLYDDEFTVPLDDEASPTTEVALQEDKNSEPVKVETSTSITSPSSLPAKPQSSKSDYALSYSAQVAKQFSAYQQTPSQERIQKPPLPLPPNPSPQGGPSAIATHEGPTDSHADRPIRPSEMKDEGKMFIGGLNWDTTDEGLRTYFSQFGKVDACTIMRDPDGRSRGFAFLTFDEPESVNAVTGREHILDGKAIDPKRAIPREEHLRNTRYFVGGLAPTTNADTMREFFTRFGKVVDATVMVDRESGRSKGFGFVTFEDSNNSDEFVGKLGLMLDDKQIEVKAAQPRSQRDQARNMQQGSREPYFNDSESRTPNTSAMAFPQQANSAATNMLYQRVMSHMPMMGAANMGMMNPMMMGMGMGGMGGMNGMGGMGGVGGLGGMGGMGMNMMGGISPMGGMGMNAMRMGMPGMGMMNAAGAGAGMGMNNMGMRMRQGMTGTVTPNANAGRMTMNQGLGPSRMSSRGQHSFHPYAR
ncbi:RNA-binding domain-containing protein [Suillus decipiens]|nr:RNA-binding domain-containing protein [Suillus decipiens]